MSHSHNIITTSSLQCRYIVTTSPLRRHYSCYIVIRSSLNRYTIVGPSSQHSSSHQHYIVTTLSLHCRYIITISSLGRRYITNRSALHRHYIVITSPLHLHCIVTSLLRSTTGILLPSLSLSRCCWLPA